MYEYESQTKNTPQDEVLKAVAHAAGEPAHLRAVILDEIAERTGQDKSKLRMTLSQRVEQRNRTKYPGLKLADLLGVADGAEIADPFVSGETIIVRNAVLLGHRAIVEKTRGWSRALDEYIEALIGDKDISVHLITEQEAEKVARTLNNADSVSHVPPRLLTMGNTGAMKLLLWTEERAKKKKPDYKDLVETLEWNHHYSLVENQGEFSVIDLVTRASYSLEAFKQKVAPQKDAFKAWFHHPARAVYSGVAHAPMGRDGHGRIMDVDYALNLWADFPELGQAGPSCELFKAHLLNVICAGDKEAYDYVWQWLAHMFQKPWEKPGVALVLWGEKRTGKGTFTDTLRAALGPELSAVYAKIGQVVGRFASSAVPKLLNVGEEAVFAKDPKVEGPLKHEISDPETTIELKFKTPYQVPSCARWIFNSNSETPVPIDGGEGRYMILNVSDARASDHEYFGAIRRELYHEGGLAKLVEELMATDISRFNVRDYPHNDARADMIVKLLSSRDKALVSILKTGELVKLDHTGARSVDVQLAETGPTWVTKDEVRRALNDAFREYGGKEATAEEMTKVLKAAGLVETTRDARNGKPAAYKFRALPEARKAFAAKHKIPADKLCSDDPAPMTAEEQWRDAVVTLGKIAGSLDTFDAEKLPNHKEVMAAFRVLQEATFGRMATTEFDRPTVN